MAWEILALGVLGSNFRVRVVGGSFCSRPVCFSSQRIENQNFLDRPAATAAELRNALVALAAQMAEDRATVPSERLKKLGL